MKVNIVYVLGLVASIKVSSVKYHSNLMKTIVNSQK